MGRKSRTHHLADPVSGQHLLLSIAAHLARTQLVPEPRKACDDQRLGEVLNVIALALARTAPLYVLNPLGGEPRQLGRAELEGVAVQRGATQLVLKDGRTLAGVSIRRTDLRDAIAILKTIGLQGITPPPAAARPAAQDGEDIMARVAELETLLAPPLLPRQVERAKSVAIWIARHAPHGRVANLAMQLMSALHESHGTDDVPGGYRMAFARLRAAIEQQSV
jgi:hypothetical protein